MEPLCGHIKGDCLDGFVGAVSCRCNDIAQADALDIAASGYGTEDHWTRLVACCCQEQFSALVASLASSASAVGNLRQDLGYSEVHELFSWKPPSAWYCRLVTQPLEATRGGRAGIVYLLRFVMIWVVQELFCGYINQFGGLGNLAFCWTNRVFANLGRGICDGILAPWK